MGNSGALLCTGLAALELSGLKSRGGKPGSAYPLTQSSTVPLGGRFSAAHEANREFSKRTSDSVKRFTEHSGLDELAYHDNVKFFFLIECSMWACPWSLRAAVGESEYFGTGD